MEQRYRLFIFEYNENIVEALQEIIGESHNFLIKNFSTHGEDELKNLDVYPDLILFNAHDDRDMDFFSTVIVKYFSEASVLLMISDEHEKKITSMPVFKKIHVLYKPVPINLLFDSIIHASGELNTFDKKEIVLGKGIINFQDKILKNNFGKKIYLTDKEILLIKSLFEENPNSLTKSQLLQKIWGYADNVKTSTLETHIYRLRKKCRDVLEDDSLIIFENGGYRIKF